MSNPLLKKEPFNPRIVTFIATIILTAMITTAAVGQYAYQSGYDRAMENLFKIGGEEHKAAHKAVLSCTDQPCFYNIDRKKNSVMRVMAKGTITMNFNSVLSNHPAEVRVGTETLNIIKRHGQRFEPGTDVEVVLTFAHHDRNVFVLEQSEIIKSN